MPHTATKQRALSTKTKRFPGLMRHIFRHDGIDVFGSFDSPKLLCAQGYKFQTPPTMTMDNTGRGTVLQLDPTGNREVKRDRLLYKSTNQLTKLLQSQQTASPKSPARDPLDPTVLHIFVIACILMLAVLTCVCVTLAWHQFQTLQLVRRQLTVCSQ